MKKLIRIMMVSCRQATELIEKKLITKLTKTEIVKLHFHTSMCNVCRRYQKQSKFIDYILRNHLDKNISYMPDNSSTAFREFLMKKFS